MYKYVLFYQLMFSLYHNRVLPVMLIHQSETVRHLGSIRKEEEEGPKYLGPKIGQPK